MKQTLLQRAYRLFSGEPADENALPSDGEAASMAIIITVIVLLVAICVAGPG